LKGSPENLFVSKYPVRSWKGMRQFVLALPDHLGGNIRGQYLRQTYICQAIHFRYGLQRREIMVASF